MKKHVFVDALIYAICMIIASLLNLIVSAMIVKFVNVLVVPEFYAVAIVRAVTGFLTGAVVLGLVIAYECYKSVSFSAPKILLSVFLAAIIQFFLALLLQFYPFIAGGTRYLAGLLEQGTYFSDYTKPSDIGILYYFAAFWITKAAEIVVCLIAGAYGKATRLKNRKTIKGYPYEETEK